ncbi:substrate-binding periplasmic protein [Kiloniella antarctica]|uniref:Substrate-binding periplasmic protein n=1 Tax=Kiloniella antarctica TaxID=1550907 RepID=A0ABW5BK60_9PROT
MKCFFLIIILMISPLTLKAEPLKLVFPESYAPLAWDDAGRMRGIGIDVLDASLKDILNVDVSYKGYPWARGQEEVRKGRSDGFVTVPTPDRLLYVTCSPEPLIVIELAVYTYANHPRRDELLQVKTYDDLKGFVLLDYRGNGWTKNIAGGLNVIWANTLEQTYQLLAARRADVVVRNNFNFDYFMKDQSLKVKFEKMPGVLSRIPLHLCIRKTSQYVSLLPAFSQTISDLREKGVIEEIIRPYGHGPLAPGS